MTGTAKTILSNTLSWEGALVEGQWMIQQGGYYYLFYSGNGYASTSYGVGVARATSPLGPFTKGAKILGSKGSWAGPATGQWSRGLPAPGSTSIMRGSQGRLGSRPVGWYWWIGCSGPAAGR